MKILISGASGMVGRNLLADPRAQSHQLVCPTSAELDLRDPAACGRFLAETRPDAVVHLAAVVGGIQANIDEPVRFLADNVQIGTNLILAAREAGVQTLINISSSCMYPRDVDGALSPEMLLTGPLEPTNEGYALAKIVTARLTQFIRRERPALNYKTLIPCNLYGRFDHFDPIKSHLVPAAIMKVLQAKARGAETVEIWGDGKARREFMYAADLADFIWTWLPRASEIPDLLNVGVGDDHSVTDYYEAVAEVCGYDGAFTYDATKPSGMRRKLLDVSAQRQLGWSPATSLKAGIAGAVEFYRSQLARA